MEYFLIDGVDFSAFVSSLKIKRTANYNAQTNAAGNTVVDYINSKRIIEVGIIPLSDANMLKLQLALAAFNVSLSFRNPNTNALETNVKCIIPEAEADFYTIQVGKTMYKAATLTFTEL